MFCLRDPHVPFWKGDFFFFFFFFFNLEREKKLGLFEKVTRKLNGPNSKIFFKWLKGPMPLVIEFFWGRFRNLDFFFFWIYIYIYIHEQSTSNATWIFRIQRNIETWNKKTNFKLNHDVATKCGVRQSWATCFFFVHLGCLRLGMLEPWLW